MELAQSLVLRKISLIVTKVTTNFDRREGEFLIKISIVLVLKFIFIA